MEPDIVEADGFVVAAGVHILNGCREKKPSEDGDMCTSERSFWRRLKAPAMIVRQDLAALSAVGSVDLHYMRLVFVCLVITEEEVYFILSIQWPCAK